MPILKFNAKIKKVDAAYGAGNPALADNGVGAVAIWQESKDSKGKVWGVCAVREKRGAHAGVTWRD